MKLKLSVSRSEAASLLQLVPENNRINRWMGNHGNMSIHRMFEKSPITKITFSANQQKYTLTAEVIQYGANLAIQPEADIKDDLKDRIKAGKLESEDCLDVIVQMGLFQRVVYS